MQRRVQLQPHKAIHQTPVFSQGQGDNYENYNFYISFMRDYNTPDYSSRR